MKYKKYLFASVVLFLGLNSACVWANEPVNQSGAASGQNRPHMGPPPQAAIDACANKKEGDAVRFVSQRSDNVQATCQTKREGLVAVPEHPPQNGEQQNQGGNMGSNRPK